MFNLPTPVPSTCCVFRSHWIGSAFALPFKAKMKWQGVIQRLGRFALLLVLSVQRTSQGPEAQSQTVHRPSGVRRFLRRFGRSGAAGTVRSEPHPLPRRRTEAGIHCGNDAPAARPEYQFCWPASPVVLISRFALISRPDSCFSQRMLGRSRCPALPPGGRQPEASAD